MKRDYSVLMAVYKNDNPEYLKISIDSMLNQTIKTNDFVIVKDGKLTEELDRVIDDYMDLCQVLGHIFLHNLNH